MKPYAMLDVNGMPMMVMNAGAASVRSNLQTNKHTNEMVCTGMWDSDGTRTEQADVWQRYAGVRIKVGRTS